MFKFTQKQEPYRIIIADADRQYAGDLSKYLTGEGFDILVLHDGREVVNRAGEFNPHLILLDIELSGIDGIEVLREIREQNSLSRTMIVFHTGRTEEYSQVAAFTYGADEYIFKPTKPRVMAFRLKALLKRISKNVIQPEVLESGEIKVDLEHFVAFRNGKKIILTKIELKILSLLATKPGKVFTRDVIMNEIWGQNVSSTDRRIDVHIRRLREKLGDKHISTIKGVGYKLVDKSVRVEKVS